MTSTRDDHLFGPGPKRILALDGGGIRGILSLQVLRRIEGIVRDRSANSSAVLSDYFDLIGGTSTGAIIAAALALGWDVDRIETLYNELGDTIFDTKFFKRGLLKPKFSSKPLRKALKREFGDICLGDPDLRTGLAMVVKRIDTGSPWIVHNNPKGRYYGQRAGSNATPNKDYRLRQIVRASTAAPHYFEPERFAVTTDLDGAFVDGGVSPHNNPALQLVLLATLEGHALQWPLGADRLLVVSVGTGSADVSLDPEKVMKMSAMAQAVRSLGSLMNDASVFNEVILQWLSRSPTARSIDREMGDLKADVLGGGEPWLTYLRYEAWLERNWLRDNLGIDMEDKAVEQLSAMDDPKGMTRLVEVGKALASRHVAEDHFPHAFDLRQG